MLTYRLIEQTDKKYIYEYTPEGNLRPGRVAFYSNGEMELIYDSEDDVKGYYRGHAFNGIEVGKESGVVAWC